MWIRQRRRKVGQRMSRLIVAVALAAGLSAALASSANALSAQSWGWTCNYDYGWIRANWPTVYTDSPQLQEVWFRASLDQWKGNRWRLVARTRWYVGVSDRYGRKQIDESLGALPYPFVGVLGHLFAYPTDHGSYAGPQLGPWFTIGTHGYYRIRETYQVGGTRWTRAAYDQNTQARSCRF
jgi:hypothetical protein